MSYFYKIIPILIFLKIKDIYSLTISKVLPIQYKIIRVSFNILVFDFESTEFILSELCSDNMMINPIDHSLLMVEPAV